MPKDKKNIVMNENERQNTLAELLFTGISNIEKKEHEIKFRNLMERVRKISEKKRTSPKKPPPPEK